MNPDDCYNNNVTHSWTLDDMLSNLTIVTRLFCSIYFDGERCWDETPAGATAYQYSNGSSSNNTVSRICDNYGQWLDDQPTSLNSYNTSNDNEWDYIQNVMVWGYNSSFVFVMVAMVLYKALKLINTLRIKVTMNLMAALALNCLTWMFWQFFIMNDDEMLSSNPVSCQIFTLVHTYAISASCMWTFTETLNLYMSVTIVFVEERKAMKMFTLIGWLVPFVVSIVYGTSRWVAGDVGNCMTTDSYYESFLGLSIGAACAASIYFVVMVITVLVKKTRTHPSGCVMPVSGTPHRFNIMKALKITLLLIPLSNLYIIMVPVRRPLVTTFDIVSTMVAASLSSFQGVLMSISFCLTHGEVFIEVKRILNRRRRMRRTRIQISAISTGSNRNGNAVHQV